MAVSTKIIKRRIRSVSNTKKITKAMELVSASKMRKAVKNTLTSRSYAGTAWEIVLRLSSAQKEEAVHPLLARREPKRSAVVLVSSNRGLCGAFNTNIAKKALGTIGKGAVEFLTVGKKARDVIRRTGASITADFTKADVTTSVAEISALARLVIDEFTKGTYDRVYLAYTNFVSSLRQEPLVKQLLPIEHTDNPERSRQVGTYGAGADRADNANQSYEYLFEPSPETLFNDLLPRLITLQIYQALLESDASEHSARMLAMRNATDAAGDMISDLTLSFNQARQAGITKEIAEISGGKAALEN